MSICLRQGAEIRPCIELELETTGRVRKGVSG